MRWRLSLEEYAPTFHYQKGGANVLADVLSYVPTTNIDRPASLSSSLSLFSSSSVNEVTTSGNEVTTSLDISLDIQQFFNGLFNYLFPTIKKKKQQQQQQ